MLNVTGSDQGSDGCNGGDDEIGRPEGQQRIAVLLLVWQRVSGRGWSPEGGDGAVAIREECWKPWRASDGEEYAKIGRAHV